MKKKKRKGKGGQAKKKAKAKAKHGNKVKVNDVEKQLKDILPLIDQTVALENVSAKLKDRLRNDSIFALCAVGFVQSLAEKMEVVSAVDEILITRIQALRAGEKDEKH